MIKLKELSIMESINQLKALPQGKLLINTINAHSYNTALKDPLFAKALMRGDALIPDGASIVKVCKWLKMQSQPRERIAGWDLFVFEMNRLNEKGGRCMFMGSSEKVLALIKQRAAVDYPNLEVVTYSPPYKPEFSQEDNAAIVTAINEANAIIDEFANMEDRKAIIVYNPGWHKGVIGIVASRLTEKYYRPAVVLTKSSELITGSARSVTGFDIYKAIENCRDLLENFGGHTYAAGLSLKEENLEAFTDRFLKLAAEEIIPEQMTPQIDIDAILDLKDINSKFMNELKRMNPFGPDNQKPVFCSLNVKDYGTSKLVGKELEHIKLELIDDKSNTPIHGIAFGMHEHSKHIKGMSPFNICYTIEENTYNGNTTLQLMVKDIKVDDI